MVIPGESHLERKIHRDLQEFRRNGEWFNPTPQVLDYVQNIQFVENEGLHAVLWRNTEDSETDTCPFCGRRHRHGKGDGHRVAHCGNSYIICTKRNAKDGTVLEQERGYIIRTIPTEAMPADIPHPVDRPPPCVKYPRAIG